MTDAESKIDDLARRIARLEGAILATDRLSKASIKLVEVLHKTVIQLSASVDGPDSPSQQALNDLLKVSIQ